MLKRRASDDANAETEQDSTGEELMAAVMAMDVDVAKKLLLSGAPSSHQDEATGSSALMLAAGTGSLAMVSLLLSNGAPWNALDRRGKCAGEYAVEGNHQECVNALVSAGVAAELLFGAVDRSVKITSQETTVLEPVSSSVSPSSSSSSSSALSSSSSAASPEGDYDAHFPAPPGQYLEDRGVRYDGDNLLDSADDAVMMAWEAPLMEAHADALCNAAEAFGEALAELEVNPSTTVAEYALLKQAGASGGDGGGAGAAGGSAAAAAASAAVPGVKENEEEDESVAALAASSGRVVLNVGFGMGIVDSALQRRLTRPQDRHFIIEPHPAVLAKMKTDGWFGDGGGEGAAASSSVSSSSSSSSSSTSTSSSSSSSSSTSSTSLPVTLYNNVTVLTSSWQDALSGTKASLPKDIKFDGVFFDTYGERYRDMEDFHALLPNILKPGGTYSFFNGMCPFNLFFHGVACELVKTELTALGFRSTFVPLGVDIPDQAKTWDGVTRKYWQRDTYYLPICVYLP